MPWTVIGLVCGSMHCHFKVRAQTPFPLYPQFRHSIRQTPSKLTFRNANQACSPIHQTTKQQPAIYLLLTFTDSRVVVISGICPLSLFFLLSKLASMNLNF